MVEDFSAPKIGLYRNISVFFVAITVILMVIVFLFFYNQATIIITSEKKDINLSFNLEVKPAPTADELAEKDVVAGSLAIKEIEVEGEFPVTTTKTVASGLVGRVKIVNELSKDQPLVKTTQLQAVSGVIVRTNDQVVVPAGGSVFVDVYPKEPETFSNVEPGRLTIIKLNPANQVKVYAMAESILTAEPREVKVLADSDISRAKDELVTEATEKLRAEFNLAGAEKIATQVIDFKADQETGAETETFKFKLKLAGKYLEMDNQQLANLISRKAQNLNLAGVQIKNINFNDLDYVITEENLNGGVLVKINYALEAVIDKDNPILATENFVGKDIEEARQYLLDYDLIKDANIVVSPSWNKKLPKNGNKIKIIIKYE